MSNDERLRLHVWASLLGRSAPISLDERRKPSPSRTGSRIPAPIAVAERSKSSLDQTGSPLISHTARRLFEQVKATPPQTPQWIALHRKILRSLKLPQWAVWSLLPDGGICDNPDVERCREAYRILNGGTVYACLPRRRRARHRTA
jgi:hypothetical protein